MNGLHRPAPAAIAMALVLSACAQRPDQIAADYVPPSRYAAASCADIRDDTNTAVLRLNELSGAQDAKATSDAVLTGVGLILFWPALFATSGTLGADDHAGEIAALKGEVSALQTAWIANGCAGGA
jgi:hypothetical protein